VRGTPSELERRLRRPYAIVMVGANVIGAVVVFALVRFVLPLPAVDDPAASQRANLLAFAGALIVAVPVGTLWVLRILRPVRAWLRAERPATPEEQRAVLLAPAREVGVHASLWGAGALAFTLLNLHDGWRLGSSWRSPPGWAAPPRVPSPTS
jgi:adenylate cyclase